MSSQDFTVVISQLAAARAGLLNPVDDNHAGARHVLITALQNENQRLAAIDPDTLTIFQSAHTLTPGLRLIQTADAYQKGTIDATTVVEVLSDGCRETRH